MAFDPSRIPKSMVEAYHDGRCAILVGAGASKGAGLPLWAEFLGQLVSRAEGEALIDKSRADMYRTLLGKPEKFLTVAAAIKSQLGPMFDDSVERIFRRSGAKPTDLHAALASLDKLPFLVTTNYDTLIEDAFQEAGKPIEVSSFVDAGDVHRRLLRREFFLLKAHGDARRIGNGIVLTEQDYRELLYRNPGYRSVLGIMFQMFSIVFVGASMADPEITLLLGYIADSFSSGSGPIHYALLAEEDISDAERERWYADFKVQVVKVSKADNYREVTELLQALATA
jgi:hypothetical protein